MISRGVLFSKYYFVMPGQTLILHARTKRTLVGTRPKPKGRDDTNWYPLLTDTPSSSYCSNSNVPGRATLGKNCSERIHYEVNEYSAHSKVGRCP